MYRNKSISYDFKKIIARDLSGLPCGDIRFSSIGISLIQRYRIPVSFQ